MRKLKLFFLACLFVSFGCLSPNQKMIKKLGAGKGLYARFTTEKGLIVAKLEFEKAPLMVANFSGLATGAIPNDIRKANEAYYDGLKFHRVIQGYMIIGGCPKGDGTGHPGYLFTDEFSPTLRHDRTGILTMENNGPNSNGSQFIITLKPTPVLDNKHSVFGSVVSGFEVLQAIQQGDVIQKVEIIALGRKAKQFNPLQVFEKAGFRQIYGK